MKSPSSPDRVKADRGLSTSIERVARFGCFLFPGFSSRPPEKSFQIAAAVLIKPDTFMLQHSLLLVRREDDAARRTPALRIDHPMPGSLVVCSVHDKTYGPRCVTLAQHVSDLAVGHDLALGNTANDFVDALAILSIRFLLTCCHLPAPSPFPKGEGFRLSVTSQNHARGRPIAGAFSDFQRQTNQFVITRLHFGKIQTFNDHNTIPEQRQMRAMMT